MAQPPPASSGDPLDDADLDFEAALASHDLDESPNSRTSTKRSSASGDYRDGAMYEPVGFGEFGAYMRNKRAKLQVQNKDLVEQAKGLPQIFRGLHIYVRPLPLLCNLMHERTLTPATAPRRSTATPTASPSPSSRTSSSCTAASTSPTSTRRASSPTSSPPTSPRPSVTSSATTR